MLTLTYTGDASEFDVDKFLLKHADEIRLAGINAIEESFELGLKEAHAVEVIIDGDVADFTMLDWEWKKFLADSIEPLLMKEDYETLIRVRELMRKLS